MNKIKVLIILGAQWGDEGKGKIVDSLSEYFDISVRFQGGPNAGHTVRISDDKKIVLHTIPSGVLRERCQAVIANGVIIDPDVLLKEIEDIEKIGVRCEGKLFISHLAHLIMPYHRDRDAQLEQKRNLRIGTTKMGVGPAIEDKVARRGIRICDIASEDFRERLKNILDEQKILYSNCDYKLEQIYKDLKIFAEKIEKYITDTAEFLREAKKAGRTIILEGAQGVMLDNDFGTYPYVTSSNTSQGSALSGTGLYAKDIDAVLGVTKCYATRVGEGPFPTEIKTELSEVIRNIGGEFGATTGRPRRVGWLDISALKYSSDVSGIDFFSLTKIDVIKKLKSKIKTIKVGRGYIMDGKFIKHFPNTKIERCEPIYEEIEINEDLTESLCKIIEEETGRKVVVISEHPGRENTYFRENFEDLLCRQ